MGAELERLPDAELTMLEQSMQQSAEEARVCGKAFKGFLLWKPGDVM